MKELAKALGFVLACVLASFLGHLVAVSELPVDIRFMGWLVAVGMALVPVVLILSVARALLPKTEDNA